MRYLLGFLIFALLVSIFAIQNSQVVSIKLLFWSISPPLVYVLLGTALIGLLAGILLGAISRRKTSRGHLPADGGSRINSSLRNWKR